jgi:hypothetical protein
MNANAGVTIYEANSRALFGATRRLCQPHLHRQLQQRDPLRDGLYLVTESDDDVYRILARRIRGCLLISVCSDPCHHSNRAIENDGNDVETARGCENEI